MNNKEILNRTLKKYGAEGMLGEDGRIMQAVLEAMEVATNQHHVQPEVLLIRSADLLHTVNSFKPKGYAAGELGIVMSGPVGQKTRPSSARHYFKDAKTLKSYALDFVEENGVASSTEIRRFMFELANPGKTYDPVADRGFYSSYFSHSWKAKSSFSYPSKNDNRVLSRQADGRYFVVCKK